MTENSMACYILHVYTSWDCSGLCLWWNCKTTYLNNLAVLRWLFLFLLFDGVDSWVLIILVNCFVSCPWTAIYKLCLKNYCDFYLFKVEFGFYLFMYWGIKKKECFMVTHSHILFNTREKDNWNPCRKIVELWSIEYVLTSAGELIIYIIHILKLISRIFWKTFFILFYPYLRYLQA